MARSGILYGSSGNRKTTAVKHFARYIYEVTGKRTKLLSMDGGGWDPCTPEVSAGIIEPYRCTMEIPLPMLRRISQGFWPEDPTQSLAEKLNLIRVDWNEFGGVAVEGMTSISQALMRYLADKAMIVGGEKVSIGKFAQNITVDGRIVQEEFAGSSLGHYGFVQNQLYSLTMNFNALPCHYVLFTALESRTEEDDRSTVFGPQIAGKKATALVPSWVGDCIHMQDYSVAKTLKAPDPTTKELVDTEVVDTIVRGYFMKHPDPSTGIMFPAKPRITPEQIAGLMKEYPGGYFEPTVDHGFDKYLHKVDELQRGQADSVRAWREAVDAKHGRGQKVQQIKG